MSLTSWISVAESRLHKPAMLKSGNSNIRSIGIIFTAAVIQRVPFLVIPPDSLVGLKKTLLVISYLLLCWGLARNLHFWSVKIILCGVFLNFVAIVVNGGLMPVSPEAISLAGMTDLGSQWLGKVTPHSTGILLTVDQTRLWFLTDIIPWKEVKAVFSVGDVVLGAGLFLIFLEIFRFHTFEPKFFSDNYCSSDK